MYSEVSVELFYHPKPEWDGWNLSTFLSQNIVGVSTGSKSAAYSGCTGIGYGVVLIKRREKNFTHLVFNIKWQFNLIPSCQTISQQESVGVLSCAKLIS